VLRCSFSAPRRPLAMAQAVSEHGIDCLRGNDDRLHCWLVVSIMYYFFPYIGNNNPNWLIFFRGVETTNQPLELAVFNPVADHRICDIDSLFRTFPDCDCMPWCHGQNGQLSESLHFTQEDSLQTSKSRGSSSFSYAKTAIIKWGHFPSRPLGDRCAKALMPGYDVQEVSKEVSRGQQWASGPVGQTAAIRYHEVWLILGLFELIGTYGLCVGLCCLFLVWICLEYMKCHFGIGCVFSKCSLQIQFIFLKEHVDHVARACVCWPWRPSEGNYLALIIECVWMCCPLIYAWSWRWYSH
jgi:hypothetical protein